MRTLAISAFVATLLLSGCNRASEKKAPPSVGQTKVEPAESPSPPPEEFQARIAKVVDGDTVRVFDRDFKAVLVQLNGIDAPELPQDFGNEARDALERRLKDTVVRIVVVSKRDESNRLAGEMFDGDESINLWAIRQGLAWYNHKYDDDRAKSEAEVEAREAVRGLWANATPVPPWVWKNPPDDGRLYVQGKGKSYHRGGCETLDGRRRPVSLEDAIQNYKPCQRCKPPTEPDE